MDKSEPSLVPEWLKNSATLTGEGTLRPHSSSSSYSAPKLVRNISSSRSIDQDLGRSSSSERISSSFSRRSYSSKDSFPSASYSNFGRNYRGRYWDRDIHQYLDRNRKSIWDQEKDVSPRSMCSGRYEKDGIRCNQSVTSARRSEEWPKRPSGGSTVATCKNDAGGNDSLRKDGYVGSMPKAGLENDFPPLGLEQDTPEIGRVPSPGFSCAIHPIQSSASAFNNGNKWISALAEAPAEVVGSSDVSISSGQQSSVSSFLAKHLSTTTGLNMAEAVALGPLRAQAAPQVSTESQRLEELAVKQCRRLIPVTPASQKPSTMNFDRVKGGKLGQLHHPTSSPLVSPLARGASINAEVLKTGNTGKLQVLKPARAVSCVVKDSCTDNGKAPPTSSRGATSSISPTPQHSSSSKTVLLEKRPTSQSKSRSEFFSSIKKKSIPDSSGGQTICSSTCTSIEVKTAGCAAAATLNVLCLDDNNSPQNGRVKSGLEEANSDVHHADKYPLSKEGGKTTSSSSNAPIFSEEEEAALLRSLGWDGNSDNNSDDDGLTQEEISDFYRDMTKYVDSRPSLKFIQGLHSLPMAATVGDSVSSRLGGSSDLKFPS